MNEDGVLEKSVDLAIGYNRVGWRSYELGFVDGVENFFERIGEEKYRGVKDELIKDMLRVFERKDVVRRNSRKML